MHTVDRPQVLDLSDAVFRLLTYVYPAAYRREYGLHMVRSFRDYCREAYLEGGSLGLAGLWVPTLLDLVVTGIEAHIQRRLGLTRERLIRASGPAFTGGGILFAISGLSQFLTTVYGYLGEHETLLDYARVLLGPALMLLLIGLIGLMTRYGRTVGWAGVSPLVIAAVGAAVGIVGHAAFVFRLPRYWFGKPPLIHMGPLGVLTTRQLHTRGLLTLFAGMAAFGVVGLWKRTLPRWRFLPLLFLVGLPSADLIVRGRLSPWDPGQVAAFFIVVALGTCWAALGHVLTTEDRSGSPGH